MRKTLIGLTIAAATAPAVGGGIPVIDVTAVANLIQQLAYWQQQIASMSNQLNQLQQTHAAMTGTRGFQNALPASQTINNYLPANYKDVVNAVHATSATYSTLGARTRAIVASSAVLGSGDLQALSPQVRTLVEQRRHNTAMLTAASQLAYEQTGQRFAAIQQLIGLIGAAQDIKAIEDLQVRVNTEQAMLQNEQAKLQTLYQMAQAQQWAHEQRMRERVTMEIGSIRDLKPVTY